MWEKAAMFGKGWVGLEEATGTHEVKGEYNTVLHKGAYKGMMDVYKQLMKDHPKAKEYYNVYLNSPDDVEEADQETLIVFR